MSGSQPIPLTDEQVEQASADVEVTLAADQEHALVGEGANRHPIPVSDEEARRLAAGEEITLNDEQPAVLAGSNVGAQDPIQLTDEEAAALAAGGDGPKGGVTPTKS